MFTALGNTNIPEIYVLNTFSRNHVLITRKPVTNP